MSLPRKSPRIFVLAFQQHSKCPRKIHFLEEMLIWCSQLQALLCVCVWRSIGVWCDHTHEGTTLLTSLWLGSRERARAYNKALPLRSVRFRIYKCMIPPMRAEPSIQPCHSHLPSMTAALGTKLSKHELVRKWGSISEPSESNENSA